MIAFEVAFIVSQYSAGLCKSGNSIRLQMKTIGKTAYFLILFIQPKITLFIN